MSSFLKGNVVSDHLTGRALRSMSRTGFQIALLAGMASTAAAAFAQAPAGLPDAQVEANVLKALASAPELANESIRTTTVYGAVTLSGSVRDEALRTRAENLAANANGVKKVIDELTLGSAVSTNMPPQGPNMQADPALANQAPVDDGQGSQPQLQSDGTYAPAGGAQQAAQMPPDQPQMAPPAPTTYPNGHPVDPNAGDPNANPNASPNANPNASATQQAPRRPMNPYGNPYGYPPQPSAGYAPYGGQQAGLPVTVPSGTLLRIRVNQRLASNQAKPGMPFDGIVVNDVVAGGAVAIPRGASIQGKVVDAKSSGALKGRGELSLQLISFSLGGKTYPIASDLWAHNGGDKTIETVNKTAGFGAIGALLGAAAGGGVGAAVGGGIGAAAGLGSSAASGNGQVIVPSEGIVTFHLAQEVAVTTVSEQEMQRLAYGVPAGAQPNYYGRPRPGYYPGYYGPVYYRPY